MEGPARRAAARRCGSRCAADPRSARRASCGPSRSTVRSSSRLVSSTGIKVALVSVPVDRSIATMLTLSIVARLPLAMFSIGLLVHAQHLTGSFAAAGLVTAAYAVALGVGGPLLGRVVDRRGQTLVLLAPRRLGRAARRRSRSLPVGIALPVVVALAAGIGFATPPVGACVRTLLSDPRAFAVEASAVELTWVFGPPLALGAGALFSTGAALAGAGAVLVGGTLVFAAHPGLARLAPGAEGARAAARCAAPRCGRWRSSCSRSASSSARSRSASRRRARRSARPRPPARCWASGASAPCSAACSPPAPPGPCVTKRPARRDERHTRRAVARSPRPSARSPPPPARSSPPSAASPRPSARFRSVPRLPALLIGLTAGHLALAFAASNVYALAAVLFLAGAAIAPTYSTVYALVERAAPAGTVTEAFAWLATAVAVGAAGGRGGRGDAGRARRPDRRLRRSRARPGRTALIATVVALRYGPGVVDVLIDADTIRSPELRHEIPVAVLDPFLYGERDGVAFAATSPLDAEMIAAARPDLRQLDVFGDLGLRELLGGGEAAARGAARDPRARVPRARRRARRGAAGVPARDRRGAARGRDRAARRPRPVRGPPAPQERGRAGRHPPRHPRRRAGARRGRRALRSPHAQRSARPHLRAPGRDRARRGRGPGDRARRVHRRQRPAGRDAATAPAAGRSRPARP